MKRWALVFMGIMFLVTACPNQKKWEESLKQWEQAVKERDAIIQQQGQTIKDRDVTITDLQAHLTTCQQNVEVLSAAAQPTATPQKTSAINPESAKEIPGLVAYYPFHGNANDESGKKNHGVVSGATLTHDRHGNAQSAYAFNGEDQYMTIPSNSAIAPLNGELSIVVWITVAEGTEYDIYDYRHILSKGATYGDLWADYALGLSNPKGALLWEYANERNVHARLAADTPIPQGQWHQVGVTFGKQVITLYVDGEVQKTFPATYVTTRSSSQPLYIGCRYNNPFVGGFRGGIDDVRIYNRSLAKAEMQKLYHLKS